MNCPSFRWLKLCKINSCIAPGWNGVNFPHSSPYSTVLYICSSNGVDNTPMLWLLLNSANTAPRLSLQPRPRASRLEVGKRLS